MATAVQPSDTAANESSPRAKLAVASLAGAAVLIVGVVVAVYVLPGAWAKSVAPALQSAGSLVPSLLLLVAQVAAVFGLVTLGAVLTGSTPPKGIRGGIFLTISAVIATFFIARAFWINLAETGAQAPVTLAAIGVGLFGVFRLATAASSQGLMRSLEDQGWFHTFAYKKTQGLRTRRYTLLGFLLIGWSGVYTLAQPGALPNGDWRIVIPFVPGTVAILPDVRYTLPLLLAAVVFWVSWRAVNMPTFADFLIATEAEMNKVSWPTRRGLYQDTIVVLVTTLLLTTFLLLVDIFWGWLLSSVVNVLPAKDATKSALVDPQGNPVGGKGW